MRCAVRFIVAAKASSVPPMASASATEASLPDWITMPLNRSSTDTPLFTGTKLREPWVRQARSDTVTGCCREIVFCASASATR